MIMPMEIYSSPDLASYGGNAIGRVASGLYYVSSIAGGTVSGVAMATGDCKFAPFALRTGKVESFATIGAQVTTVGAASFLRLGVWANGVDGKPGTLLIDAGQIDASAGAAKEITFGSPLLLAPGEYWLGVAVQGTGPVSIRMGSAQAPRQNYGSTTFSEAVGAMNTVAATGISGAFASNPSVTGSAQCPIIVMKAS